MKILFLCTGNSCRSQMAEGWCRHFYGDSISSFSAGTKKHGMNPRAVSVMKEVGVDISHHESNTTGELSEKEFDVVFTVCGDARENCPYFPGSQVIHIGFEDPPRLTKDMTNEEEILTVYRRVRDEIKSFVENIHQHIPS